MILLLLVTVPAATCATGTAGQVALASQRRAPSRMLTVSLGCGTVHFDVPDSAPWFDFHDACAWHDRCYGSIGFGSSPTTRTAARYPKAWCDSGFRLLMERTCHNRRACLATATLYWRGVTVFGWPSWHSGTKAFRIIERPGERR